MRSGEAQPEKNIWRNHPEGRPPGIKSIWVECCVSRETANGSDLGMLISGDTDWQ